jgi:hypothetical protein
MLGASLTGRTTGSGREPVSRRTLLIYLSLSW